jgi:hypothetical protein
MQRHVIGFYQDEETHWVARLECGHGQHVRHNPPWSMRPWALTETGRASQIGNLMECKLCDEKTDGAASRTAWQLRERGSDRTS